MSAACRSGNHEPVLAFFFARHLSGPEWDGVNVKKLTCSAWHGLCQYLPGRVSIAAPHEDSDFWTAEPSHTLKENPEG